MKLTQSQQNRVYTLVAVGSRPVMIQKLINEEYKPTKEFTKQQVNYYLKVFKALPPEEQIAYLPYTLQESFARQEVRINSDIQQVQKTLERLGSETLTTDEFVQLSRLLISQCNRIGQELGQVRAMSKAGVGNLYLQQNIYNKFSRILDDAKGLSEEDRAELYAQVEEEKRSGQKAIDVEGRPEKKG